MNKERMAVLATGAGAALLLANRDPEDHAIYALVYIAALAGIRLLTDQRVPKPFVLAPIVPWLIHFVWEFFHRDREGYMAQNLHPALDALSDLVVVTTLFVTVLAAAPKIGWGAAGLSAGGLVLSTGAESMHHRIAGLHGLNPEVGRSVQDVLVHLRDAGAMGRALVPFCWIAVALAPFAIPAFRSRKLAMIGAIGAAICRELLGALGGDREHGHDFAWRVVALYSIGWLFTLLGIIGVARSNKKGLVWAGFALCVVQVVACPTMAGTLHAANMNIVVAMAMAFGMLGLAFVAFSRDLPLRRFRLAAGVMFAGSMLGSCFTNFGVFLSLEDIVRIKGDPSQWWTAELARWCADWGFFLWCGILALFAAPPTDDSVNREMKPFRPP